MDFPKQSILKPFTEYVFYVCMWVCGT